MSSENTPLMNQIIRLKKGLNNEILFFRKGDFYEMFGDDAIEVSRLLNLTLTHRGQLPMCGIPYRAANSYIKRLLDEGNKIAITAQTELISESKSDIINREVVQIITPATVVEDDFLNSRASSYILSISFSKKETFVSYSDITTGEFYLQSFEKDSTFQKLSAFLTQIGPREILVNEDDYFVHTDLAHLLDDTGIMITKLPSRDFSIKKVFSIDEKDKDLGSADALLKYIKDSSRSSLSQIIAYTKESDSSYLQIDASTRKSLEILKNTQDGGESNTLFSTIDKP